MVGIDGKGIRADFYNKNPKHYKINIDNDKKTNTGYTTKHLSDAKHKANFVKLDSQLAGKSDAGIRNVLQEIDGGSNGDKNITKSELEAYLNRPVSSSNFDAIKAQSDASAKIRTASDSLYKTMIAHDGSKKIEDVKEGLKELFKTGKAPYKDVENFLTTKLGWTKEAAGALFLKYLKDNGEISLHEFLSRIHKDVRDFNENVRGQMPGFESGQYFQKYTKFNITKENEVNQVFDAAVNSNDSEVKKCREEIEQSYAKTYTSSGHPLSTNWTAEMKQAFYIKLAETANAKVLYTIEVQPASGKKKATTKTVAGFYKVDHNKLLEKYFKELLAQKQAEETDKTDKTAEKTKAAGQKRKGNNPAGNNGKGSQTKGSGKDDPSSGSSNGTDKASSDKVIETDKSKIFDRTKEYTYADILRSEGVPKTQDGAMYVNVTVGSETYKFKRQENDKYKLQ